MTPRALRSLASALVFALLLVALRMLLVGRSELTAAREARERGDEFASAVHHERAIRAWLPGSPYSSQSIEDLQEIAEKALLKGKTEEALEEFRMLRSAILSIRSLYQPYSDTLNRTNEQIALLMARDRRALWPSQDLPEGTRRQALLENLRESPDPDPIWVVVLELGFLTWLSGTVGFLLKAHDPVVGWNPRATLRFAMFIALGYATWIVGMALA